MAFNNIANSESGATVRVTLNNVVDYLNNLGWLVQFSANGSTGWHYPFTTGDGYIRYSANFGTSYSPAFYIGLTTGELSNFVEKEAGKRLITDAEAAAIKQYVYTIILPAAATVAGRLIGTLEHPSGWVLEVDTNPADLKIIHGLERGIASVTVFSGGVSGDRLLLGNAAYSGIFAESQDVLRIEALATIETDIIIQLVFA
jgi:hypothetical protein